MEMDHIRSVPRQDRQQLNQELSDVLNDLPEDLRMQVTRAAMLSTAEAQRILVMAEQRRDDLDVETVQQAREIIEQLSVHPS